MKSLVGLENAHVGYVPLNTDGSGGSVFAGGSANALFRASYNAIDTYLTALGVTI